MSSNIGLLDCTLRDGAYITDSHFGEAGIRGIIRKMQEARADIIEIGWLKDKPHQEGSSFFNTPNDIKPYLTEKSPNVMYVAMIDWDRYNVDNLSECDGESIDAIRVVFPYGKHKEGIKVGEAIRKKGYKVMFQAANTLAYSDEDLDELAECINEFEPYSISVVDTFGAMFFEDLEHIVGILDKRLNQNIGIGFHAHNNQQLAFALSIRFIELIKESNRSIVVDSTLCGLGRGAGNTTTELMVSYLNRKQYGNYDINAVLDAIDIYMAAYQVKYKWGYSTPYFIAGMYQCHVNNIAYLMENHRTNTHDMRTIIESLSVEERRKYDYDLLEDKYIENQSRIVDDSAVLQVLKHELKDKKVLLVAPGKSIETEYEAIQSFIEENNPVVIAVNALNPLYQCDYAIFINPARYEYACGCHPDQMRLTRKILLSNIKTDPAENEVIINYNTVIKRGWEHFDNAVIITLRLLNKVSAKDVYIAGFDGFKTEYNKSYADAHLPSLNPDNKWEELNAEIKGMYNDLKNSVSKKMNIKFITPSCFDDGNDEN